MGGGRGGMPPTLEMMQAFGGLGGGGFTGGGGGGGGGFRVISPYSHVPVPLPPSVASGIEIVFRVLCPGSRTGSIIGRNGDVIRTLRAQTGAKIKVLDAVPGQGRRWNSTHPSLPRDPR